MKRVLLLAVVLLILSPLVQADDLYFVPGGSADDAAALQSTGAKPIARLEGRHRDEVQGRLRSG